MALLKIRGVHTERVADHPKNCANTHTLVLYHTFFEKSIVFLTFSKNKFIVFKY